MEKLNEVIDRYGRLKSEMDTYKKSFDADNNLIKELMQKEKLEDAEGSEFRVTCKEIKSEKFNDDKLVSKLRSLWSEHNGSITCPYIKTVYIPDMEEIEKAIYNGELNAEDLVDCKEVSTSTRLNVYKLKK